MIAHTQPANPRCRCGSLDHKEGGCSHRLHADRAVHNLGRCDYCRTRHPLLVLHADTSGAYPPTPADLYSANKRTTLLCIHCVHGPDAHPSILATFTKHLVIHDVWPTDTH